MLQHILSNILYFNRVLSFCILCIFVIRGESQDTIQITHQETSFLSCNLYGFITDSNTGENLIGANVFVNQSSSGTSSDLTGRYSLSVQKGIINIEVSYVGYTTKNLVFNINSHGQHDIKLDPNQDRLQEIIISASDPQQNLKAARMGVTRLSVEAIERLPTFVGETDILKSLVLLPGVISVGEASSGVNVRGGGTDENLILLGGAPIYNPSHLFGFFSAFNSNLINNVTLFKGGIPSRYGGRASSIIDMSYKKGDFNKWNGELSLGTIASTFSAGGPLLKNKLSVLVGGRLSYANWILKTLTDPNLRNSSTNFYDINVLTSYKISDKNTLDLGLYNSHDNFNLLGDDDFSWSNKIGTLNWNYSISDNFFLKLDLGISLYNFGVKDLSLSNNFEYLSSIDDRFGNIHFDYKFTEDNILSFGGSYKRLQINPGEISPLDQNSDIQEKELVLENGNIQSAYFHHDISVGDLAISYGLRYSSYNKLGKGSINTYLPFLPRDIVNVESTTEYGEGDKIVSFNNFEPRVSLRYLLGTSSSIKLGYNRMSQYLGLISNTTTIAPTDIWKLSDSFVKPLLADQYSIGFFKNIKDDHFETSVEVYYKDFQNITEYKDGANLILNEHIETELLNGVGRAYGVELLIKKNKGDLTGWLGYTFSRSQRRVIGFYEEETINNGNWYSSNFDKPHDLTAVVEYKVGDKLKMSSVFTYSQGRPVSYPVAKFNYQGQDVAYYDLRNENRIPSYHRLDFSMTFNLGLNKALLDGDWILSFYNIYGRKNAFSVFFDDVENAPPQAYRLSTLGIPFPSLSYKIEF